MSDDDSSSSEDLPLSALGKKAESSEEEAEFDEESEEEEEEEVGDAADSDDFIDDEDDDDGDDDDGDYDSDSSDDAPLSSLKAKKKAPAKKKAAAKAKPAKKSTSAKKKKAAPKKKKAKKKATTTKSSASTSNYLCASGELYAHCDKGKLIQSLLARWWYAYEWPDPAKLPASTPEGYDALDGFPGVYICTRGCDVGKFLDHRNHDESPSFKNFARKGSEELQGMLLSAIEEQMKVLLEHEGSGTETEKNLKTLEKWAGKLNCSKADKEAEKVLKAKKLKLS